MWSVKCGERKSSYGEKFILNEAMPAVNAEDDSFLYQKFTQEEWNHYNFAPAAAVERFLDLKFGIFLHIGLSVVGQTDLSWPRKNRALPDTGKGFIEDEIYDGWASRLSMENFNEDEWAETVAESGATYVIIVAKHHDGFHMWDTAYSEHKITKSPFGRDYLKIFLEALRKRGVRTGIYFSQRDWYHKDYQPITEKKFLQCGGKPPYYAKNEKVEITEKHHRYIEYMKKAVTELVTCYGNIDFFWWDSLWWGGMFVKEMWDAEALEQIIRSKQPDILINNRNSLIGDFDTPEVRLGNFSTERAWETCIPLCGAWGHDGSEPKSMKELMKLFIGCLCGGGESSFECGSLAERDSCLGRKKYSFKIRCVPEKICGEHLRNACCIYKQIRRLWDRKERRLVFYSYDPGGRAD